MYENFDFKKWFVRFFTSLKGWLVVCFIFAVAFYMFIYGRPVSNQGESEATYNALKEIAYNEAEQKNTDFEISNTLLKYEISTLENGMKSVTLVGKNNINFKFYLSPEYEVIEINDTWKITEATTIFAQILSSLLVGMFYGFILYLVIALFEKLMYKNMQN